jgi:hypothetical protein
MVTIARVCDTCGAHFEISPVEQRWLRETAAREGWSPLRWPRRCFPCRAAARRIRYRVTPGPATRLFCADCGAGWLLTAEARAALVEREHCWPRRCSRCRDARRRAEIWRAATA